MGAFIALLMAIGIVSIPKVWLLFPDVLSNGIESDATEPADNPVLETLQNIDPITHVVQAVYSILRKSTLSVSQKRSAMSC